MEPLTMFGRSLGFYRTLLKKHCSKCNNRILCRLCCPRGKTEMLIIILTKSDTQILCFNIFCVQTFLSHHHRWYVQLFITLSHSKTNMTDSTDTASSPENLECKRHSTLCTNNNPTADTAWVNCVTLPMATTFSKIIIFFSPLWCFEPDSGSWTPLTGFCDHTHWTHHIW